MTYWAGQSFASALIRRLAGSRVRAASTKRSSPSASTSPSTLRMQKGRRIQTPHGGTTYQEGQWSNYRINLACWVKLLDLLREIGWNGSGLAFCDFLSHVQQQLLIVRFHFRR